MRTSQRAPWPQQWPRVPRHRHLVLVLGLVVLGTVAAAAAVRNLAAGWDSGFRYPLLFSVVLAELAVLVADARLRPRKGGAKPLRLRATRDASTALEMPYSRVQFGSTAALMVSMAAPFLLAAIGALDMSRPNVFDVVFYGMAILVLLSLPMLMLSGLFALGTVQLSTSGIYHRGWTHESYLPWEKVAQVRAVTWDGPEIWVVARADANWQRRQLTKIWKEDRLPDSAMLRIPGRDLSGDPALLHQIIQFYFDNPDERAELGTHEGAQKARAGRTHVETTSAPPQ